MKLMLRILMVLVILAVLYLTTYPVPIDPEAWTPQPDMGLKGKYQRNEQLSKVERMAEGLCPRCEDIAIDGDGNIYAGAADGRIIVFNRDFSEHRTLCNTGGRPLGMVIDSRNNLFVADDTKGLLWIQPDGHMQVLTNTYQGQRMRFLDDIALAPDSSLIFTEASRKFTDSLFVLDIMEHRPNGSLFRYDLKSGKTDLLMDSLFFANGVAIAADGSYVLVNNMNRYEVLKYFLAGERMGQVEVLVDNLPGFPDGVNLGPDGIIWISIPTLRIPLLDRFLPYPFIRKIFMRMPLPKNDVPFGFILGFDQNGNLKYNLQDSTGHYAGITNAVPYHGKLYLGSIREHAIGVLPLTSD